MWAFWREVGRSGKALVSISSSSSFVCLLVMLSGRGGEVG